MKRGLACLLSVLAPGLGQMYLGARGKGLALLCITCGIGVSLIVHQGLIHSILMAVIYVSVMIPAAMDAYRVADGGPQAFQQDPVFYVILMLFLAGPFAIPLLWQSSKFTRNAKILWTLLVMGISLFSIVAIGLLSSALEPVLR